MKSRIRTSVKMSLYFGLNFSRTSTRFALGLIGANGEISGLSHFKEPLVPKRFQRTESIILKARRMRQMLDEREVRTQTELAIKLGMSRVRVTQLLNLLKLPRKLQIELIKTRDNAGRTGERQLRRLLLRLRQQQTC